VGSDPASLAVLALPRILWQPESVAVRTGNSFQLAVGAASSEPLSYQWLKEEVEVPGATDASYKVISAQASHTGTYRVRISNSSGSVLSREVTVTIAVVPQITQQPSAVSVNEGGTLQLSFQASGTPPFVVEWLRDNVLVQVTNITQLVIPDVKGSDAGNYVARVTGPGGTASTAPVSVRVETKPVITSQPQSAALPLGANITLTVSAVGNGAIAYQWLKDGQPMAGATSLFLVVSLRTDSDFGQYTVRVANAAGATESEPALIQKAAPPAIIAQPASVNVLVGSAFSLAVDVQGTSPYTVLWLKDGVALPEAISPSINVSAATASDAGTYHVAITNRFGSVQSANAIVRVVPHIVINRQPTNATVMLGSELNLSVQAISELPLSYLWFRDDVELEGQSTMTLTIPRVTNSDEGSYRVVVMNEVEEVSSEIAEVNVALGPDISGGQLTISTITSGLNLVGQGVPGATYEIQVCTDLSAANWTTVQTVTADASGLFQMNAPTGQTWFLRTMKL
jgi:hypothetical protein